MDEQRILIIEDDETLRSAIQEILEYEGYAVSTAGDGEEALKVVREAVAFAGIVPAAAEEGEALRLLCNARESDPFLLKGGAPLRHAVGSAREKLEADGIDRVALEATATESAGPR